jgi:acyl-CoA hydrolase
VKKLIKSFLVGSSDLNTNKILFGGKLLCWIDELVYDFVKKEDEVWVTGEINYKFLQSAELDNIVMIDIKKLHHTTNKVFLEIIVKMGTSIIGVGNCMMLKK